MKCSRPSPDEPPRRNLPIFLLHPAGPQSVGEKRESTEDRKMLSVFSRSITSSRETESSLSVSESL